MRIILRILKTETNYCLKVYKKYHVKIFLKHLRLYYFTSEKKRVIQIIFLKIIYFTFLVLFLSYDYRIVYALYI